jgi:hypothetical protein
MAGAVDLLKQSPVPVFASPRLGVAASLGRLTASAGQADKPAARMVEGGRHEG